jgi:hypothetical protein
MDVEMLLHTFPIIEKWKLGGAKSLLSKKETAVKVVSEFQNLRSKKLTCGYGPDLVDITSS